MLYEVKYHNHSLFYSTIATPCHAGLWIFMAPLAYAGNSGHFWLAVAMGGPLLGNAHTPV